MGLIAQLTRQVVEAERELERHARELTGATEDAVVTAKAGDLRTSVRGDLLAAVSDKAAAVDAALMKVAERRQSLAIVAESVKAARPKPAPELAEGDVVTWTWDARSTAAWSTGRWATRRWWSTRTRRGGTCRPPS